MKSHGAITKKLFEIKCRNLLSIQSLLLTMNTLLLLIMLIMIGWTYNTINPKKLIDNPVITEKFISNPFRIRKKEKQRSTSQHNTKIKFNDVVFNYQLFNPSVKKV